MNKEGNKFWFYGYAPYDADLGMIQASREAIAQAMLAELMRDAHQAPDDMYQAVLEYIRPTIEELSADLLFSAENPQDPCLVRRTTHPPRLRFSAFWQLERVAGYYGNRTLWAINLRVWRLD